MSSTTPRPTPSRPTTPLRPSSRTSLRSSKNASISAPSNPLESLEPAFAEFSDSMADLEANMMHLQLMHESLARFSENFAAFLYGMNMNAFCVDFPEAPIPESFRRPRATPETHLDIPSKSLSLDPDLEATVMTTDSFVEHPPASSKASSKYSTPAPASRTTRGGAVGRGRGRGIPRGSGIARGAGRARGRG